MNLLISCRKTKIGGQLLWCLIGYSCGHSGLCPQLAVLSSFQIHPLFMIASRLLTLNTQKLPKSKKTCTQGLSRNREKDINYNKQIPYVKMVCSYLFSKNRKSWFQWHEEAFFLFHRIMILETDPLHSHSSPQNLFVPREVVFSYDLSECNCIRKRNMTHV